MMNVIYMTNGCFRLNVFALIVLNEKQWNVISSGSALASTASEECAPLYCPFITSGLTGSTVYFLSRLRSCFSAPYANKDYV